MNGFQELTFNEVQCIDGGKWYDAAITFVTGITGAVGACGLVSGSGIGIATMGVGSLLACGPAGWAVLGVGAVLGAATGAATVAAWKK